MPASIPFCLGGSQMRRWTIGLLGLVLVFAGAGQIHAERIRIDFERFSDRANLHGINLGGVTLTSQNGKVEVYDDRFGVAYHSGTKAVASLDGLVSVNPLIGVFDYPVSSVSLWGGDKGTYIEQDSWQLFAYDAPVGGRRVDWASSGSWNGDPYRQLRVTGENIWRFEAIWTGPKYGIGYDDLEFVPMPPPPPPPPPEPKPSNGSFEDAWDLDSLSLDLGIFEQGVAASSVPLRLYNLTSGALTVALNLDSIVPSGHTDVLKTSLTPFSGLAPNSARDFMVSIDTSKVGEYYARYLLKVSDTTGVRQTPLTLDLKVSIVPEPPTVALASIGLVGLLVWGWRKRKGT